MKTRLFLLMVVIALGLSACLPAVEVPPTPMPPAGITPEPTSVPPTEPPTQVPQPTQEPTLETTDEVEIPTPNLIGLPFAIYFVERTPERSGIDPVPGQHP